jgi:fibronectin type 3 domain-containing protein
VESADSEPTLIAPRDILPPATPTGLETAIIPASPQGPAYVELSWAISTEEDLAGYFVYRSDREDTPGIRINAEIFPSPAFRDISVQPGKRYYYRVSALDRAGNESPMSAAVVADVP